MHVNNPLEGRVEVCYDGVWGTVCSQGWGARDAAVVCRQLGYSSSGNTVCFMHMNIHYPLQYLIGATARTNALLFGQGSGPILLHSVSCRGLESRLLDCPNGGIEMSSCSHRSDAGVTCLPGFYHKYI